MCDHATAASTTAFPLHGALYTVLQPSSNGQYQNQPLFVQTPIVQLVYSSILPQPHVNNNNNNNESDLKSGLNNEMNVELDNKNEQQNHLNPKHYTPYRLEKCGLWDKQGNLLSVSNGPDYPNDPKWTQTNNNNNNTMKPVCKRRKRRSSKKTKQIKLENNKCKCIECCSEVELPHNYWNNYQPLIDIFDDTDEFNDNNLDKNDFDIQQYLKQVSKQIEYLDSINVFINTEEINAFYKFMDNQIYKGIKYGGVTHKQIQQHFRRVCNFYNYLGQQCKATQKGLICKFPHTCTNCCKHEIKLDNTNIKLSKICHPSFVCPKMHWIYDYVLQITHWPHEWINGKTDKEQAEFGLKLFSIYGQITSVITIPPKVPDPSRPNLPVPYAYITFKDVEGAVNALKYHKFKHIKKISEAKPANKMYPLWTWRCINKYKETKVTEELIKHYEKLFHNKLLYLLNNT